MSRYEALAGRALDDLEFFEMMEEFFMATTLIRQADARVARGLAPPDTRMGHDNTVTQMLARRLAPPRPRPLARLHRPPRRHGALNPTIEPASVHLAIRGVLTQVGWTSYFAGKHIDPSTPLAFMSSIRAWMS